MNTNRSFEKAWMLEQIGGDLDLLREVVRVFLDDSHRLKQELARALAAGDAKMLHAASHATKSAVGNFGAHAAVEAATQLELACKNNQATDFDRLYQKLAGEVEQLVLELKAELDTCDQP